MYTLGQIARVIWPATGDLPNDVQVAMLTAPLRGLALASKKEAFHKADQEQLGELISRLPADLTDPPNGVPEMHQMPFWIGYYHYLSAQNNAKEYGKEEFAAVGTALYGARWQTDLARDLNLSDARRIRQWMAGERPIPVGVWADLGNLLRERQFTISDVLVSLNSD